jgi:ATP-dependent DNA ligase
MGQIRVTKGQELVIGGYRTGKNYFGNLALGYYDDAGTLILSQKFKNGLTPDVKKQVFERLRPLETKVCSFDKLPEQQLYSIWTRESHVCDEKRSRENGAP